MGDRRRNTVVLLVVAVLLAASAFVIATKPTRLGLDLKGGVSLVYKGIPTAQAKVDDESLNRAIDIMRQRVDQLGVAEPEIQRTGADEIDVSLPAVSNAQRAQDQVGKTAQLQFYDWEPNVIGPEGTPAPSERSVTGGPEPASVRFGLPEYKAILRAAKRPAILRPNDTTLGPGCTPAQVNGCIYGAWYLIDTKHEKVLCGGGKPICGPADTQAELYADGYKPPAGAKVKAVRVNPGTVLVQAHPEEFNNKVLKTEPNSFYVLNDDPVLNGEDINNPQQGFQSEGGSGLPDVTFGFSSHGRKVFEAVTKQIAQRGLNAQLPGVTKPNAVQHFAIVLDEQVITAPSIDYTVYPSGIDASNGSQISGGFTLTSAQNLADELQSGALPIKLTLISQSQVSATLGKQALRQGLLAGLVGLAIVCLFLLIFYRVLGVIAVAGLAIYSIYYFALIKAIPITMTLPGIAGLILTIGIAADANIVIFERVKEEIRSGRSIPAGIAAGYKRGFAAIVDANVVTFMTAFILFALATSGVRGFAFTLGIGTLLSLFTAVLATQAALGAMGRSRLVGHPSMLGAARRRRALRFDFMGASRWFFSLSGTILLIGALAIGAKGLNLGIDFKSGTRIQTAFVKPASEAQIRSVLDAKGFHDAQIQKLTKDKNVGGSGYQISLKELKQTEVVAVENALNTAFILRPHITSDTSIGPTFGKSVAKGAIIAIIASLLVISAYIALRFEWKYAVPVLIALMHDLLITAGVYSLTGREVTVSTVAALLTILGYSLYDTIIVFDRVRENVPRMPRAAFSQIVNRSMSEVLTRSLATSFCTLLPVIALLLFGGETLKDFAFALMVGIASGAYSSIFIASPVLTHWKEREGSYRNRRARLVRDLGYVPAYATTLDGTPIDVEPVKQRRRRGRQGSLIAPEEPGEQVSKEEFDEMVRDLDIERGDEQTPARTGARGNGRRSRAGRSPAAGSGTGTVPRESASKTSSKTTSAPAPAEPSASRDPAADLTPEDLVLKEQAKPSRKRPRNRRHGRSR